MSDEEENEKIKFIKNRLEEYVHEGVSLYIKETPATPGHIAKYLVREEETYMPDLINNERGKLVKIKFDQIRQ